MRLTAALLNDVRLQVRYGLYGVSVLMVLIWGGILGALSRNLVLPISLLVPPFVAVNLLITTFYFMAGLVLFEKAEGVLPALVATPLRTVEYLLSKSMTLALLASAETLLIVAFIFGMPALSIRLIVATLLLGVLYSLIGFLSVVRFESINGFLIPSVFIATFLLLPLTVHFNVLGDPSMAWHPVQPAMLLIRNGSILAAVFALFWCALALLLACREFDRFVVRS